MSTTLKLTGIKTFMSALMFNINLARGDVICVSDDVAGRIGGMHRMSDNDNIKVFYFTTPEKDEPLTYDFTHSSVIEEAKTRAGESDYMRRVARAAAESPNGRFVEPEPIGAEPKEPPPNEGDDGHSDLDVDPNAPGSGHPTAPDANLPAAPSTSDAALPASPPVARKRAAQRGAR